MPEASAAASLRLFLALWPDESQRAAISAWQRSWQWPPGAKLVAPERLHLTLHFIGNVPSARLPELATGLRVPFEAVELEFGDAEVWRGGIAVLRPHASPEPLLKLQARLATALTALGLPVEDRPYRPHVTLARRAVAAKPPASGPALRWHADSGYVLVRTVFGGGGYQILERFTP